MKIILKNLLTSLALALFFSLTANAFAPVRYYYELKVYHFKTQAQEDELNQYLKNAYIPAIKKITNEPVGVFRTLSQDTDKRIYVLTTYTSWSKLETVEQKLDDDQQYLADSKVFAEASYDSQPYTRVETIILHAFPKWPAPTAPHLSANKADRVYELRSYESPTEKYHVNKVKMFNDGGETVLFNRLNFNAIFYADVVAGSHMPNLMYMTTFENKADRDKHWDTFSNDAEWKTLSAKPEYQHNVSKADILFLHPTEYSDY